MVKLYQLDSGNKLKTWTIEFYTAPEGVEIKTTSQLGETGKISEDFSLVKTLKQGYKDLTEQASYEVQSKINSKKKAGWKENPADARPDYILGNGSYKPLLAFVLDPYGKIKNSKTIEGWGLLGKFAAIQPKLDGNRLLTHIVVNEKGIINSSNVNIDMFSREGEIKDFPHIKEAIIESLQSDSILINSLSKFDIWVDGEIYNHKTDFDFINGTYRNFKDVNVNAQKKLEYHIYDCWVPSLPTLIYKPRMTYADCLFNVSNSVLHKVETHYIEYLTQEILDEYLEKYVALGYEGIMVRCLSMPYEFKRSKQLLKYKPARLEDAEFECVGVNESAFGSSVGSLVFKMENGETFKATPNVPQERCVEWWNKKDTLIGKKFTVVFQSYTQYGKPRFPKVKAERD